MTNGTPPANSAGLPQELIPHLAEKTVTVEYASIKSDGTPITAPLAPFLGDDGQTIDIATGLAYPLKAERARRNPKVSLLYAEPKASLAKSPPVILVYGEAAVYDADLQANLDRFIRLNSAKSATFANTPPFLLRWLSGYLARIWVSVTPQRIVWWAGGDLDAEPQQWLAPAGTQAPPSDPPPKPLSRPHKPIVASPADWGKALDQAVENMGAPTLTVVGDDGYPAPFKVQAVSRPADGLELALPDNLPAPATGRACLNFYTVEVKNDEMVANETVSFIGEVSGENGRALFKVERQLPNLHIRGGLLGTFLNIREMRSFGKRAEIEAARRGQSVPTAR